MDLNHLVEIDIELQCTLRVIYNRASTFLSNQSISPRIKLENIIS